ncbi:MAG: galactokinase [Candidatus Omnitrophota bacterium]
MREVKDTIRTINSETIYRERYGKNPSAASQSPGRVEILGNHTDYNGGYVLTTAIDKSVTMHGEALEEEAVILYSQVMNQEAIFPLLDIKKSVAHPWANYVLGVIDELRKIGVRAGGFRAVIGGDLPIGGGLSSSAALETATAMLIQALYPYSIEKMRLAILCRRAENLFVGMPCGILDPFSVIFGEKDAMLFLDCDNLSHKVLSIKPPVPAIVLCDSGVKHALVDGEYKSRRHQCEAAAQIMGDRLSRPVRFLRDVTIMEFLELEDMLDDVLRRRTRHVMYENQRVLHGVAALQINDVKHLGELMRISHESSRDNFENTCPELDVLVEEAAQIPGCFGSKVTGGGFGGATVNLVAPDHVESFCEAIKERFADRMGKVCKTTVCAIGDGARILYK